LGTTASVRVARGATYLFIQGLIGNLAGVVYFAFAARLLPTVAELGVVTALSMVSTLFVTFACLALPGAVTKYVAEYVGRTRLDIAKGVSKAGFKIGIATAFLSFLVCFLAAPFLAELLLGDPSRADLLRLLAIDIIPIVLVQFSTGIIYGLQDFRRYCFSSVFSTLVRFGGAVFLLFRGMGVAGILIGWIVGDYVMLALTGYLSHVSLKCVAANEYSFRKLLDYSTPLYGSGILSYFSSTIDRYVVLGLAGASVLGIYSPAVTAAGVVGIVTGALSNALFPQLSEMYGRYGVNALKDACRTASRYVSLIYMPLAVGLAVTALPVITLFAGDRYSSGAPALAVIALASAFTCLGAVLNNVLLSIGRTRIFLVASVIAISVDSLLCILLVGPLGSLGAAISRAALILSLFLVPALWLRSIMGLNVDSDAYLKSLIGSAVMAGVVMVAEVYWTGRYLLPVYILIGGTVYLVMLRLLRAVKQRDIELVKQFLPFRLGLLDLLGKILAS